MLPGKNARSRDAAAPGDAAFTAGAANAVPQAGLFGTR